jgi:hypothetical protein
MIVFISPHDRAWEGGACMDWLGIEMEKMDHVHVDIAYGCGI